MNRIINWCRERIHDLTFIITRTHLYQELTKR